MGKIAVVFDYAGRVDSLQINEQKALEYINRRPMPLNFTFTMMEEKKAKKMAVVGMATRKALRLMDADFSYKEAVLIVLMDDGRVSKAKLERELSYFI